MGFTPSRGCLRWKLRLDVIDQLTAQFLALAEMDEEQLDSEKSVTGNRFKRVERVKQANKEYGLVLHFKFETAKLHTITQLRFQLRLDS